MPRTSLKKGTFMTPIRQVIYARPDETIGMCRIIMAKLGVKVLSILVNGLVKRLLLQRTCQTLGLTQNIAVERKTSLTMFRSKSVWIKIPVWMLFSARLIKECDNVLINSVLESTINNKGTNKPLNQIITPADVLAQPMIVWGREYNWIISCVRCIFWWNIESTTLRENIYIEKINKHEYHLAIIT